MFDLQGAGVLVGSLNLTLSSMAWDMKSDSAPEIESLKIFAKKKYAESAKKF